MDLWQCVSGGSVLMVVGAGRRGGPRLCCRSASCRSLSAQAGGDVTSGLPVPRFVSLKTDRVNVRGGPDKDHDVAWIYTRVGWPVEITAEFENWRRIRDSDGTEGWVYHSLLSGKRMAAVRLKSKTDLAALHAKPDAQSAGDGAIAVRRARHRSSTATAPGAASPATASTAGSSRTACGASIRTRRSSNAASSFRGAAKRRARNPYSRRPKIRRGAKAARTMVLDSGLALRAPRNDDQRFLRRSRTTTSMRAIS